MRLAVNLFAVFFRSGITALSGVLVLCSACAEDPGPALSWPVHIGSVQGFSEDEKERAFETIHALNANLASPAIYFTQTPETKSQIDLEIVETIPPIATAFSLGMPKHFHTMMRSAAEYKIAGRATLMDGHCKITLAKFVLKSGFQDLLDPVLWHEIGHAGGLVHVNQSRKIMSPATYAMTGYTEDVIDSFFDSFAAAIGYQRAK